MINMVRKVLKEMHKEVVVVTPSIFSDLCLEVEEVDKEILDPKKLNQSSRN